MDDDARRRRREEARRRIYRRRRLTAAGIAGVVALLLVGGGLLAFGGEGDDEPEASTEPRPADFRAAGGRSSRTSASSPTTGRRRTTSSASSGIGIAAQGGAAAGAPGEAVRAAWPARAAAFELIAAIVTSEPGDGGDHSMRQDDSTIRRYLRVARAHRMLLVLDIQPGYAPFLQEAKALERWLREPDVGLALDPEWSMKPPLLPAQEIGSTDAATVNEVSRYLSASCAATTCRRSCWSSIASPPT